MPYSNEEAALMMSVLGRAGSFRAAEIMWRNEYPDHTPHSRKVFSRLQRRIIVKGIVQPDHNKGRQIHRSVRSVRAPDVIASAFVTPNDSLKRRARDSGISRSTISRIFRENSFHPYRMSLHQAMTLNDHRQRLIFCNWITQQLPNFHRSILFSDECTFKSDGEINTHNFRYWAQENPHWYREMDHQRIWKVNVWCGIVDTHIVGPFFFQENLNRFLYADLLKNELPRLLEDIPLQLRLNMWFQQDGCPAHTSVIARHQLNRIFRGRWIGKHGPHNWPPRSPDLTILDYYLWGRIKDLVYRERPTTAEDMKNRIRQVIQSLDTDEIRRATDDFQSRVTACINARGGHFEHRD